MLTAVASMPFSRRRIITVPAIPGDHERLPLGPMSPLHPMSGQTRGAVDIWEPLIVLAAI